MTKAREYSYSDVDMLVTSKKIAESFNANLVRLAPARTDWTQEYGTALIGRIDVGLEKLGIDPKRDLREATVVVKSIQKPAHEDLAFFKTQIDDDFKKTPRKGVILQNLGFSKHLRDVQKGKIEPLIELLFVFKVNMTPELRTEITAKGLNPTLIERIIGYTNTLVDADISQETFKDSSKEVTQEVGDSFNIIYSEIIGICKKASKIFKNEPLKKNQFTFSKMAKQFGVSPKKTKDTPPSKPV